MDSVLRWASFENGSTLNTRGSESGVIVHDEEYANATRITLERACGNIPFAITCGIYGWFFHTRFFSDQLLANEQYDSMKAGLVAIVDFLTAAHGNEQEASAHASALIDDFVARYP